MRFIYALVLAVPGQPHFETTIETAEPVWQNDAGFFAFQLDHHKQATFNPAFVIQMDVTHVEG